MIRTPIDPVETFTHYNPLSFLRGIRFADRFNFELAPGFIEAARCLEIQQLLLNKVSVEKRSGELEKILYGN